jgi:hypothetical protein
MGSLRRQLYRIGCDRDYEEAAQRRPPSRLRANPAKALASAIPTVSRTRRHRPKLAPSLGNMSRGACAPFLRIGDRPIGDVSVDSALVVGVREEEAMITQKIDDPGKPDGILRDGAVCGLWGK